MNSVRIGAIFSALGIILGAFGAHALKEILNETSLKTYETGTHYLILHAFGLILFGLSGVKSKWVSGLFLMGILLFTGSLYAIAFTGTRVFGIVTPFGGVAFIVAWIIFAFKAKLPKQESTHS